MARRNPLAGERGRGLEVGVLARGSPPLWSACVPFFGSNMLEISVGRKVLWNYAILQFFLRPESGIPRSIADAATPSSKLRWVFVGAYSVLDTAGR
eukprot:311882-Rhodomonas_salina.3